MSWTIVAHNYVLVVFVVLTLIYLRLYFLIKHKDNSTSTLQLPKTLMILVLTIGLKDHDYIDIGYNGNSLNDIHQAKIRWRI